MEGTDDARPAGAAGQTWDISTLKGPKTDSALSHSRTLALPPQRFDDLECIAYVA
jgi:hypothetical protein